MADFQKAVALMPAVGVPGAYASDNPIISTARGFIAASTVTIGAFVWEDTTYAGQCKNAGSGKPLGFACREVTNPLAMGAVASNSGWNSVFVLLAVLCAVAVVVAVVCVLTSYIKGKKTR